MKRKRLDFGLVRTAGVLVAIAVVLGGVTFAALRSQNNTLSGSRMTSASADLTMAKQDNGQWYTTLTGFDFFDLVPGGEPGPRTGNDLYFRNGGTTNLDLRFGLNLARLANPNGINLQKVRIVIIDSNGGTVFASPTVAQLADAHALGNTLPVNLVLGKNSTTHLQIRMQLDDGAVGNSTSQISLENIDVIFSGSAQV